MDTGVFRPFLTKDILFFRKQLQNNQEFRNMCTSLDPTLHTLYNAHVKDTKTLLEQHQYLHYVASFCLQINNYKESNTFLCQSIGISWGILSALCCASNLEHTHVFVDILKWIYSISQNHNAFWVTDTDFNVVEKFLVQHNIQDVTKIIEFTHKNFVIIGSKTSIDILSTLIQGKTISIFIPNTVYTIPESFLQELQKIQYTYPVLSPIDGSVITTLDPHSLMNTILSSLYTETQLSSCMNTLSNCTIYDFGFGKKDRFTDAHSYVHSLNKNTILVIIITLKTNSKKTCANQTITYNHKHQTKNSL